MSKTESTIPQQILQRVMAIEKQNEKILSKLDRSKNKSKYHKYEGKVKETYEGDVSTFKRSEDSEGNERFSLIVPVGLLDKETWFAEDGDKTLVPVRLKDGNVVLTAIAKDVELSKEFVSEGGETVGKVCVFVNDYARVNDADGKPIRMRYVSAQVDNSEWDAPF